MDRPMISLSRTATPDDRSARRWRRLTVRVPMGRLAGFPVYLSPSWLPLAAVLIFGYGRLLDRAGTPLRSYLLAVALVAGLVASVLLHELGHALACRGLRIGVRAVTLDMLGGYTEMEADAPTPRTEAAVSMAGPAVSFGLGLLGVGILTVLPAHTAAHRLVFQLAVCNLLIAGFNSLPGLPLDGGRALLALVWWRTGDRYRGTLVAGWVGRGVAVACLVGAVVVGSRGGPALIGALAVAVVAVGVGHGGGLAVRLGRLGGRLALLDVAVLARPVYPVPAGIALDEAHRRALAAGSGGAALGVADRSGRLVAVVDPAAAAAIPVGRRAQVQVEDVARRLGSRVLPANLRGADVIDAVRADPNGDYLVASGEDVVGVLRGVDVANLLTSRETAR
jgi:Zn-dependent protease